MKLFVASLMLFASNAVADIITLTMDEVSTRPINGLVVTKGGLNFTFTNPAGTLFYNSGGPGTVTFVQDPSIQGTPSIFGVVFSAPVYSVQFGLAELASGLIPLATVDLFNGSATPFATLPLSATLSDPFSEGRFTFSGAAVTDIRVTPNTTVLALAFDNLAISTTPVPEPTSVGFLTAIIGVLFAGRKRLQSASRS